MRLKIAVSVVRSRPWAPFLALLLLGAAPAPPGFTVDGSRILDGAGRPFTFRGVNLGYAWLPQKSAAALPAVAATGANSVRLALGTGCKHRRTPAAEVQALVRRTRALGLVTILEVHDSTGLGEDAKACPVSVTTDYWRALAPMLAGTEGRVVINIANEPRGNVEPERWVAEATAAVTAMRAAGYRHLLMVDGPNWGQDRTGTMRDAAPALFAADPLRWLAFDVHMYGNYPDRATVDAYLDAYRSRGLALVVGEFGPHFRGTDIPADHVMAASAARASGYLAWSWSPNHPDENLDLVEDWNPKRPTPWGRRVFATFTRRPASPRSAAPPRPASSRPCRSGSPASPALRRASRCP
jgi:mannan endo-1,4-beta-mannosidase